ncbi:MAG: triose-phosphate isomerase [Oscillospiraceae bacterium]|nr:triose-phosphate isomerase [Oscillospiraceae bacterium]MCD8375489.1 triose-phosphate isomerase [Oscillospiraceae bacterium]
MNRRYRKPMIAGNWKMNLTPSETRSFAEAFKPLLSKPRLCEVALCVPFIDIPAALKACKGGRIAIGAQNMHELSSGAYTGEVSAQMLRDLGVKYVIIGHSERRQYYNETDATVNKKVLAALEAGLRPIVCVGESLEQRQFGVTLEWITCQVKAALYGVPQDKLRRVVIAYEPLWAIGTGQTATAEQAGQVCNAIRTLIRRLYDAKTARSATILYGGSMNEKNAAELLAQPDIDGGLIGGASLKPEALSKIVQAANQE